MPNIYPTHASGDTLPAADWNLLGTISEASFLDHGAYVVSGLTVTAGSGLSVNVALGKAIIGADISVPAPISITSLTDATLNHLWLLQNGTGTSNTTGTPPTNSTKLGTATCAGGVVTVINMGRSSGRQQFVQPQNIVHGGLALGITSAGHPRSVNLSSWQSTPGEGFEVSGTLPSGAADLSAAVILAPNTPTRNTITPTADANAGLLVKGFSLTQTAPLIEGLASDNTVLGGLEAGSGGGGFKGGFFLEQRRAGQNCMLYGKTTALRAGIILETPVNGGILLQALATGNAQFLFGMWPPQNGQVVGIQIGDPGDQGLYMQKDAAQTAHPFIIYDSTFSGQGLYRITASEQVVFGGLSSTATARDQAIIDHEFLSNTDATWKGRGLLKAVDSAGTREAMRWEADGAAVRIGVYGHAAVVRPAAYTVTNPTSNRSFDETAVTLTQIAQVLGTVIADLQSIGWLG
jgi:hypothetical protein